MPQLLLLLLLLLHHTTAQQPGTPTTVNHSAPRPNILVLLIDDMGWSDLGAFGSPNASTPHIDALIGRGVKLTSLLAAAPICTPSRAALQTGRYPIRTGCMGNVERYRVIPTPANPHGLDPQTHVSLATALKRGGYRTGMSGKWHLGINGEKQDRRFTPRAHGYETYLGAPYTNAPMCAMDSDGVSQRYKSSPTFCFMVANDTVVESPLRLENFTRAMTRHATDFIGQQSAAAPWFFFMSYFHVHTPLFSMRQNRGRSRGGAFGDNVEELDDSVGAIAAALREHGFDDNTLVFLASDNGPYQEEGWAKAGRTNLPASMGGGRLRGGKGQTSEGGIRVPGAVVWPGVVAPGSVSHAAVSLMDVFPTALRAAGVALAPSYAVDGRDMAPLLRAGGSGTHEVLLHYCGFSVLAARVWGRWKVVWAQQKWYTHDARNASVCLECCNGVNPWSHLVGAPATEVCGCSAKDVVWLPAPAVFDMAADPQELRPMSNVSAWPADSGSNYSAVVAAAAAARDAMEAAVHPKPDAQGAGSCTSGWPAADRQPCCPGCAQHVPMVGPCVERVLGKRCECRWEEEEWRIGAH